jgi:hypothetical protein
MSIHDFSRNSVFHNFGFTQFPVQVGWDTLELNLPIANGSEHDNPKLNELLLAEISTRNFTWLGLMGLNVQGTNLTDIGGMKQPQPTMLSILKRNNIIPSLSWAYTAGSRSC